MNFRIVAVLLMGSGVEMSGQNAPPVPPVPPRVHNITTRVASRGGYLGVGVSEPTPGKIEITRVDEGSPAAKAGLKESDVIGEVGGQKVDDIAEFVRLIGESAPGSKVSMVILRGGSKQNISATLAARPAQPFGYGYSTDPDGAITALPFPPEVLDGSVFGGMMGQSPRIGFEGEALAGQLAEFFGVKEGVLVRSVVANMPAAKAGLKAGDVIVKVGGTPVSNTREISGVMRAMHRSATLTVIRNHKEITLNVEIAWDTRGFIPAREVL